MSGFPFVLLYFLLDRELYFILHSESLTAIYAVFSKCACLLLCLIALKDKHFKNKIGAFICALLPLAEMLLSTIVNDGDVRRASMMIYSIIGMMILIMIQSTSKAKIESFVHSLSLFYFVLCAINFVFLLASPHFFNNASGGDHYFLGTENQIGYPLMKGFCFVYIDSIFKQKNKMLLMYSLMHCITILIIFSGSNIVGYLCMMAIILLKPLSNVILSIPILRIIGVFIAVLCALFLFNMLADLLQASWMEYIVVELLGKNLTLTNRTNIWELVVEGFYESPWLGHGIRETVNLFYVFKKYFSAHNQYLQSLYESGSLFYVAMIPLVKLFSDCMNITEYRIRLVVSATCLATMIMLLGEAVGMASLFTLFFIGLGISGYYIPKNMTESK